MALVALAPTPAVAACTPPAANNISAICSGITIDQNFPNGYGGFQNQTVTVLPGASVIGTGDDGIRGNNLTVFNNGAITGDDDGISASGLTIITNNGTITGQTGDGIVTEDLRLINKGIISGALDGINPVDNLRSLYNTGTISGGVNGILGDRLREIINAGTISGGDFAILEERSADTNLTLLQGSILIGPVDLGGGVNTLNVGKGLSIMVTFDGAAPVIGSTGGQPFVVRGTTVAVVSPTSLAAQDDLAATLTTGISSTVTNRLNTARLGGLQLGGGGNGDHAKSQWLWSAWVQGYGAFRFQSGDGAASDSRLNLGGAVAGADRKFRNGLRAGFFLGGAKGLIDADNGAQETDVSTIYFGAYAQGRWDGLGGGWLITGQLTGGILDYDRRRDVANNQAAGGLQKATAGYWGWFIAPEVTVVRPIALPVSKSASMRGFRLEPGVTARYTALRTSGFNESGSSDNLTVNARTVHVVQGIAHLAAPIRFESAGGSWRVTPKIAVEGRSQLGSRTVAGTLLGQGISFDPGGARSVAAGIAALSVAYTRGRATFYFAAEGKYESDGSHQASVKGGLKVRF